MSNVRWYNTLGVVMFALSIIAFVVLGGIFGAVFFGLLDIDPGALSLTGLCLSVLWTVGIILGGSDG